jgi:nucleoside-diphosphate-sugar epimerase
LECGGWGVPKKRKPDIAKTRALLGWEPRVTLDEGQRETVGYFRGIVGTVA